MRVCVIYALGWVKPGFIRTGSTQLRIKCTLQFAKSAQLRVSAAAIARAYIFFTLYYGSLAS